MVEYLEIIRNKGEYVLHVGKMIMDIRNILVITGGLVLAGIVNAQSTRPNVIVIYTDDQGSLDMNCYGAKDLCTPNMDALAKQGVRFSQFYGAPVSSVSRASLLTGQFAKRVGLTTNAGSNYCFPPEKETIAERMKANGYRTALIGKWHLGDQIKYGPNANGFDYFWGFRGGCFDNYSHFYYWGGPNRHDLWQNEREIYAPGNFFAAENLKEIRTFVTEDKEKPFFLYWAVNIPHYPLQPTEEWLDYYADLPNPRRMYAAFVSTFDDYLGELCSFLAAERLDENTILIFQSDNGHSMEERTFRGGGYSGPYRAGKFSLFEGGIRVPAVICWPGKLPEGQTRDQVAMNIDWFPTIVDLCGLSTNGMDVDGKSLVPMIKDGSLPSPHKVLHFDFGNQWAIRYGDWKLISNPIDVTPKEEKTLKGLFLSNLGQDETEQTDFKDQFPEKVKELQAKRDAFEASLKK